MSATWIWSAALAEEPVPLTPREGLSGIFLSISLTCWIFLLLPQLIENYRLGSADAISLLFVFVWSVGDAANLVGAIWAGLVPALVAIAAYFCLADGVLVAQCIYYRTRSARGQISRSRRRSSVGPLDPTTPLLGRIPDDSLASTLHDAAGRRSSQAETAIAKVVEEGQSGGSAWAKNTVSVLGICVIGIAGWMIAWRAKIWKPTPLNNGGDIDMAPGAQVAGYISATAYLGARLPQIYKNYCDKSCDGLSLLFFILSLAANLTYGAGILCHSTDKNYVITNLPWLIGSLGTMVEDIVIFAQFRLYAVRDTAIA